MADPYKGRYCKDCKWFEDVRHNPPAAIYANLHIGHTKMCYVPLEVVTFCPIRGKMVERRGFKKREYKPCDEMRTKRDECGPEGKLWEPIDPTPKTD